MSFAIGAFSFMVTSLCIGEITRRIKRRYAIFLGFLLMGVDNMILGPSTILGIEPREEWIYLGMLLMGISLALTSVPTLAELIEILKRPMIYSINSINFLSVGVYNAMFSLGNILAPFFGSVLFYYY
jgi:MFS family permease